MMFDVVVVGSGLAGLYTALHLAPLRVALLTPNLVAKDGCSYMAQGGIAASLGAGDSWQQHADDSLRAGCGHNDLQALTYLVRGAESQIEQLTRWGVSFDRVEDGQYALGREAFHAHARIVKVCDHTGFSIMEALSKRLHTQAGAHIVVKQGMQLVDFQRQCSGRVDGVVVSDRNNIYHHFRASYGVVLATGGIGQLYRYTTNPRMVSGQGLGIAIAHGVKTHDMEFVQFHPTGLAVAHNPVPLISEAVRGAGGRLRTQQGNLLMEGQHPAQDLAPRDVVARAVHAHYITGGKVFLDIRDIENFSDSFPQIVTLCQRHNIDWQAGLLPVTAVQHYHMGGIAVDRYGRSSLEGLFAVGEVACTGVHGANRLASNSLLEALVYGQSLAQYLLSTTPVKPEKSVQTDYSLYPEQRETNILPLLADIMMNEVGIVKHMNGLGKTRQKIQCWLKDVQPYSTDYYALLVAQKIVQSALNRATHNIGSHYCSD